MGVKTGTEKGRAQKYNEGKKGEAVQISFGVELEGRDRILKLIEILTFLYSVYFIFLAVLAYF